MSPAATPEAEQADLIRRMSSRLTADAAQYGVDLTDPNVRKGFETGLTVALGLILSAHESGNIDDGAQRVLEDLFGTAILSLSPDGER